jgi:small subunit ribosomal protein S3
MGQKVHPIGFRLGITQKHQSYWCTTPEKSRLWIQDASFLRAYVSKAFVGAGITRIEIQRQDLEWPTFKIEIQTANPKRFSSLENFRDDLVKRLRAFYRKRNLPDPQQISLSIDIRPLKESSTYAAVLAEKLVEDLEQRKPFRRAMRQTVKQALRGGAEGIKVQISGRLNGADIARAENVHEGPVPLQTIRADIDYSSKSAKTIFGLLGVKVWVFRGERLTRISNLPIPLEKIKDSSRSPKNKGGPNKFSGTGQARSQKPSTSSPKPGLENRKAPGKTGSPSAVQG